MHLGSGHPIRHYLDANATEPLRPEAREAVVAALSIVGNPSSVHGEGRHARRLLEDARDAIAARFGARADRVVFTSGATEANALALHALRGDRQVIVGATEHDSVIANAPGARLLPVDRDGIADLDVLEAWLAVMGGNVLVVLMLANNETGALQTVNEIAVSCHRRGALLHVDAVQAAGRMPVMLAELGADSLALSSHKLGGPHGAGALLLSPDAPAARPLIAGGGQERGFRAGTPPLACIAGFAAAADCAPPDSRRLGALRDAIESAASRHGAVVCGGGAPRLANTACLALPGVRADAQVIALDLAGIAVSAGAACSSGKVTASHVLKAMGLGELAGQAIRVSLPWNVEPDAVEAFATAYADMAARLRASLVSQPA